MWVENHLQNAAPSCKKLDEKQITGDNKIYTKRDLCLRISIILFYN